MSNLKTIVRGAYDIQMLRIQMGNRIVGNFKAKLGQKPSESEDNMDKEGKEILNTLRQHYRKLTDGVKTFPKQAKFKGDEVISSYTELVLMAQFIDLEKSEKSHFQMLNKVLDSYSIYTEFLQGVKGIGPAMAGVIISEIDIHKAKYPSSIWMYAGLDVAEDGRGRSRRSEHLVDVEYKDKNGEIKTRRSITFNPFLKTKLMGVLGASFLRAGENPYSTVYYDYKNRLDNREDLKEESKGHRHNMATRYMIKMFLIDLYIAWRSLEGLPVAETYQERFLDHKHKS